MMNDQDYQEYQDYQDYVDAVPAYVLGALEPDERSAFEARMRLDTALHAEVLRYQEVVAELALAVAPVRPPAALKTRLLAEIQASAAPLPAARVAFFPKAARANTPLRPRARLQFAAWGAALLVTCLAVALFLVFSQLQTAIKTSAQLAVQLDASRRREQDLQAQARTNNDVLARLQQQNAANEQLVRFLSAADLTTRNLGATGDAPSARGAMYMRPGQRDAVVVVSGLPPLPSGDTYQFWLAKDGLPTQFNAGVLLTDTTGNGQLVLQAPLAVNDFTEVMVTLEHEQHAAAPSKMTFLYGTL